MKTFVLWPYYLPVLHAQGISLSPPRSEKQEVLCRNKEVPERLKLQFLLYFSQFSYSFMTNSLRPHGLQHTSPACPSPSPGACSNSCPLSWWCQPVISPSVIPFSSCLQLFPSSGSFWMSQFFALGGQSSFNISPSNELSGLISFRIDWLVSLQSKGPSKFFSNTTVQRHQFFGAQRSLWSNSICDYGKTIGLTRRNFVSKVMSLLFNMLSRLIIAFLPRSKHLLISWLQ